jgi:hypothetical protein
MALSKGLWESGKMGSVRWLPHATVLPINLLQSDQLAPETASLDKVSMGQQLEWGGLTS